MYYTPETIKYTYTYDKEFHRILKNLMRYYKSSKAKDTEEDKSNDQFNANIHSFTSRGGNNAENDDGEYYNDDENMENEDYYGEDEENDGN